MERTCRTCGNSIDHRHPYALFCDETCRYRDPKRRAAENARKKARYHSDPDYRAAKRAQTFKNHRAKKATEQERTRPTRAT